MFKTCMRLLMDEAGDGGSGGGTGSGGGNNSLLGGAGSGNGSGGAGDGGKGDAGSGKDGAGDKGAAGGGTPNAADWRSSLSKDLQEHPSLKKITSVEALAGSFVNAQKMIGADKLVIPGKHSTDEDWTNVYRKLGVPEKLEEYGVKFKDGVTVDEKFSNDFRAQAHKLGVLPKQAQALADWFSDINLGAETQLKADLDKQFQAGVANLKKDWGNSFELNVGRANRVLSELGGKEISEYFVKNGLGGNEQVIRLLAKVGETLYKEHKFVEGQDTSNVLSPKELDAEIRKLQADPAYLTKEHPNHKAIVTEVQGLFADALS